MISTVPPRPGLCRFLSTAPRAVAVVVVALLWGCDTGPTAPELPVAPAFGYEGLEADAKAQFTHAGTRLRQEPTSAAANAHMGRLLHAYAQPQPAAVYYQRARTAGPDTFELAHLHGLALSAAGARDEAVEALRQADELKPLYAPTLLKLAELLADTGNAQASRHYYHEALKASPNLPQALLGLGQLTLADDPSAAVRLIRRAATVSGSYGAAHYALAQTLRDSGDGEGAREELEAFERHRGQAPYLDDPVMAEVRLLNLSRDGHLERALSSYRKGRFEESALEFERSLEKDPANTMARQNLIAVYAQLGRYDDAETQYRLAVERDPDVVRLHTNYATLHLAQNNYADAIEAFERAIEVDPGYGKSYVGIGAAHEAQGDHRTAIEWYRTALENDPYNRQARQYLATALVQLGHFVRAIDELTPSIGPDDVQTAVSLRVLAKAQAADRQYDQAEQSLIRAERLARRFGRYGLADTALRDIEKVRTARALSRQP